MMEEISDTGFLMRRPFQRTPWILLKTEKKGESGSDCPDSGNRERVEEGTIQRQ